MQRIGRIDFVVADRGFVCHIASASEMGQTQPIGRILVARASWELARKAACWAACWTAFWRFWEGAGGVW